MKVSFSAMQPFSVRSLILTSARDKKSVTTFKFAGKVLKDFECVINFIVGVARDRK